MTILSAIMRLWSRRVARHTGLWMHRFMPSSVFGARATSSSADAAWDIALDVDMHRSTGRQLTVITMDQRHCFDRLSLDALSTLAQVVGFPSEALFLLGLYKRLRRHLFIDGQPTG